MDAKYGALKHNIREKIHFPAGNVEIRSQSLSVLKVVFLMWHAVRMDEEASK